MIPMTKQNGPTIGVFDSGFGGLTVLRALLPLVPAAHYIYLGDTARLPYGSKSQDTIARFAVSSARYLEDQGANLLVIACNTATALALPEIRAAVSIPVVGVIAPGAQAVLESLNPSQILSSRPESSAVERPAFSSPESKPEPQILVLATAATVHSHAYRDACDALNLRATEKACPLLVPLVEEGWTDHPVTRDVLRIYLSEALAETSPDAVLLGCTHYPLIAAPIEAMLRELGSNARVIDSAEATAQAVVQKLAEAGILQNPDAAVPATFQCFATDSVEKFARLGSHFLGRSIPDVELLDFGG
jgi:glutamate racemase